MGVSPLLRRDEAALCIVDIQEKLSARMEHREKVTLHARMLAQAAIRLEVPVIVTEQYPRGLGATVPELIAMLGDKYAPIEKLRFGCAEEPAFMDQLKSFRRKQVIVCGMEAHVCILQTCLELADRKYQVHVPADAITSRRGEDCRVAIEQMRQAGIIITCTEAVIFQLLERAGTPEFKDLLGLFK